MTTSTTKDILAPYPEKRNGCVKDLGPFHVSVTRRFLFLTLIGSSAISFLVGHSCRQFLLSERKSGDKGDVSFMKSQAALHSPVPPEGQEIPDFVYTGHTFQDGFSRSSDSVFLARIHGTEKNILKPSDCAEEEEDKPTLVENHHPTGRQLLVDIENVDGTFLNSESQLADAMIELVGRTGMTMLSYHCHRLFPVGVSCIGILLKSHVSFHTWPISGVVVLDILSTNGGTDLISQLEVIEELFAIPRLSGGRGANPGIPHLRWAHHHRGFQQGENRSDSVDLNLLLGWMEHSLKTPIVSEDTDFQTVTIYDVIYNRIKTLDSYKKSLVEGGNTYEAQVCFVQQSVPLCARQLNPHFCSVTLRIQISFDRIALCISMGSCNRDFTARQLSMKHLSIQPSSLITIRKELPLWVEAKVLLCARFSSMLQ